MKCSLFTNLRFLSTLSRRSEGSTNIVAALNSIGYIQREYEHIYKSLAEGHNVFTHYSYTNVGI